MKKILLFSLLIGLLVVTGCGQQEATTWSKIQNKGKLVVGMDAAYRPFEYHNQNDKIVGFDVDMLQAVADQLGVKLVIKDTAWDGIIPGLKAKKYDVIASAMTITEQREKAVDFSNPYFNAGQVVAVLDSNNTIKSVDDLTGKVVGVQLGTTGDLKVSKMEGIKKIKRYGKIPQAFIELQNGRLDAVVNDLPVTAAYIMKKPNVKIVGEPFTSEQYGIAIREADDKLTKKVNAAIKKIKENGTYDKIYNKWFK
ncbi:periplasmic component of amino acid ABC-type transporter/signal transduction system [Halobacteroides halobius DSM 5150]|uniref:Periplasmic component of amino acid ABC-type transporter/signal transduction system n=1 Tax=Halobacteroides halobius (strain ATCC 35273 / DSM 5150 / MD-1) TaxID=748449 RepID=L0KAR8_HALHC|nr:basic amino acid ABC transporter substrate-binding protein [Halobacteroides halobius]AGB42111.1 periplasmic component of amino acid ABC-type transporter/signal transduction system [Halobacteroides halobius DSM 5150]